MRMRSASEQHRGMKLVCLAALLGVSLLSRSLVYGNWVDIGFVLDIRGSWYLNRNSSQQVFKGSALPAGGTLTFGGENPSGAYVNIADQSGKLLISQYCRDTGGCSVQLPAAPASSESVVSRVFRGIMGLWRGAPGRYGVFRSQGNNDELREAVLKLADGKVDLSLVLAGVRKGRYVLNFKPLPISGQSTSSARIGPLTVDWDPQRPASLSIPNLQTGLYEIQQLEEGTLEPNGPGTEAWALIANPADYEKLSSCFSRAQAVTKEWGANVKANTVRSFLRGDLDYLAANGAACD